MQTGALLASAAFAADISALSFDELKRSFLALFPRRSESIWKKPEHKRWFTSRSYSLSDQQMLAAIEGKANRFVGLRFAQQTKFAVIDIDTISPYYNVLSLVRLRRALEAVGLEITHLYQSSSSQGWHLWLFFDAWVNADELNKLLAAWLKKQGFSLGSGVLEIFPSANGLRLPLQSGFAWLPDGQSRDELTLQQALRRFVFDSTQTNHWDTAAEAIAAGLADGASERAVKKRRSGLIPEKWKLGKELWRTGLQQRGQRHDAILAVEHYLWFGDEDAGIEPLPGRHNDAAREQVILGWLETKHNGHCKHINRGDWRTVVNDVQRACVWRTSADIHRPYAHTERKMERMMEDPSLTPRRFITGNLARENYAQKRIFAAYEKLAIGGRRPLINEVAKEAGSDWRTVRKYWNLLAASGGDQSPGVDHSRVHTVAAVPSVLSANTPEFAAGHSSASPVEKSPSVPSPAFSVARSIVVSFPLIGSGVSAVSCSSSLSQLVAKLLSFNSPIQDFFRTRSVLSGRTGWEMGMESAPRIDSISKASDARLSIGAGNAMLAEINHERTRSTATLELKSSDRQLVSQGVLPGADSLLGALHAAQSPAASAESNRLDRRAYFKQQAEECYLLAQLNQPEAGVAPLPERVQSTTQGHIAQGYSLDYAVKRAEQKAVEESHRQFDGKNATTNSEFLDMFLAGSGNDRQVHDDPSDETLKAFMRSPGAAAIREQYAKANFPAFTDKLGYGTMQAFGETMLPKIDGHGVHMHYTNPAVHVGGFGNPPKGQDWAATTATRCDADGKPNSHGDSVQFQVVNVAGLKSWLYHLPFVRDREIGEKGQYRTIVEVFRWTEAIPKQEKQK